MKRELLKAQKAHSNGDYSTADQCYHSALHLLSSTEHAQNQTYLEAKAVTMDKVIFSRYHTQISDNNLFTALISGAFLSLGFGLPPPGFNFMHGINIALPPKICS